MIQILGDANSSNTLPHSDQAKQGLHQCSAGRFSAFLGLLSFYFPVLNTRAVRKI